MSEHAHEWAVDAACECGLMISDHMRWLTNRLHTIENAASVQASRAQAAQIAALETELKATANVLETYFPGRKQTAPHDLAFLLGQKVATLEAEIVDTQNLLMDRQRDVVKLEAEVERVRAILARQDAAILSHDALEVEVGRAWAKAEENWGYYLVTLPRAEKADHALTLLREAYDHWITLDGRKWLAKVRALLARIEGKV